MNGLYLGHATQLVDHHTAIHHAKPNCNSHEFYHNAQKNLFYRQPAHIAAAGTLGLGISDLKQIDHRRIA